VLGIVALDLDIEDPASIDRAAKKIKVQLV